MHFKCLELRGFKSFAQGVEIHFQPGINVIVGPNGCGKSNIADAIRWVLGEANIRNLRGQRGEDVIFSGTDKKRPLGMATVSITFDNQDNVLNSDYSEISVTRRIYRNADSQFLINLSEVRLKDIHSLFAGTGLGKKGYSIIGQGELEQLLDAKPFERRLIVEEAAGLSGYRQKKHEAEIKLQASGQDLIRLEDILGEVRLRVSELEIKALKARSFLQLSSELGFLERRILAYDLYSFEQVLNAQGKKQEELSEQLFNLQGRYVDEEQSFKDLTTRLVELREENTTLKENKHQLVNRLNLVETENRLSRERIDHARERLAQMETDMGKHHEIMNKLKVDLDSSAQELTLKEKELSTKSKEAKTILDDIKAVEEDLNKSTNLQEQFKTDLIDLLSLEASLKNQGTNLEERLRKNRDKIELGKTENTYRLQRIEGWQETLNSLNSRMDEGKRILSELHQEKGRLEAEKERVALARADSESQIASLETSIRKMHHRLLTLEEGIRSHIGLSEGVRRLIKAIRTDHQLVPGFLGVVTDLLEVPPGLEIAIEAAAGRSLENVVVKDYQDAQAAINLLKTRSWGRATFLPQKMLRNRAIGRRQRESILVIPGVLGLGVELVRFAPEHRPAIEHVLGRVLIVENLDIGLQVFQENSNLRIVTVKGDIINPSGAMTGGKYSGQASSPLRMKASYREELRGMKDQEGQMKTAVATLEQHSIKAQELDAQIASLKQQISESVFQLDMLQQERERIVSELDQGKRDVLEFQSEERIIMRENASLEAELSETRAQLTNVQSELGHTEGGLEEQRSITDQLSRQLELLRERHAHCCDLVNLRQRELNGRRQALEQLKAVKQSYDATLLDYRHQIEKFTRTTEVESNRIENLNEEKKVIVKKLSDTEEIIKDLERETKESQHRSLVLQEAMTSLRQQLKELEDKIKHLEIKKARLETERKNVCLLWEEKFTGESFAKFWEGIDNRQQREMRQQCQAIKQAIEELGPVDVSAIDELEEVNKRCNFLEEQLSDVNKAREALIKIIEETETLMNSRFEEFLSLANASFRKTFSSIFSGGEAELMMEEHENSWESGVDIMVKMPGKRRQPLNLLSGGERALTCIALIFSLLVLNPTPFCLFDEIDSSLDDANLGRFCEFLKRLSSQMQFIVITHRQGTIEAGDHIFGVTMPEQGMSEVYSLTAKEAEILAG